MIALSLQRSSLCKAFFVEEITLYGILNDVGFIDFLLNADLKELFFNILFKPYCVSLAIFFYSRHKYLLLTLIVYYSIIQV